MKKLIAIFIFGCSGFVAFAQTNTSLTVHEWGTFTTLCGADGASLTGLHLEEEHLPSFVKSLSMTRPGAPDPDKGWPTYIHCYPANVTVKMETPVLYFYTDKQTDFKISVGFNNGLITQWYPSATSVTPEVSTFCNGPVNLQQLKGGIEWRGTVLAADTKYTPTEPATESHTWLAPRETKSNLIKAGNGEVEKYLFYRGMGNFSIPVTAHFDNNGRLYIGNTDRDPLDFVMVYNKTPQGAEVWWVGKINSGEEVRVLPVAMSGKSTDDVMKDFINALVAAGLYKDEAEAMLSTWKKSYFETEGLKIFWIVPRHLTDEILPLQMEPAPQKLERVLVGRAEILTPEFEQLIYKLYNENKRPDTLFRNDRFKEAYKNRYTQMAGAPNPNASADMAFYVYPNPATSSVNVYVENCKDETGIINVFDATGRKVHSANVISDTNGRMLLNIDLAAQPPGIFIISIALSEKVHTEKVVITK